MRCQQVRSLHAAPARAGSKAALYGIPIFSSSRRSRIPMRSVTVESLSKDGPIRINVLGAVARPNGFAVPFIAWSIPMLDIIVLAIGLGFFALSVGYTIACDRL